MSVLVNFEDKYGVCDIMFYHFFGEFFDNYSKNYNSEDLSLEINRDCGSEVLLTKSLDDLFDKIIFVYDMDKLDDKGEYNILSSSVLENKIKKLNEFYKGKELKFVPTVFAAETICLHMAKPYGQDFSTIFSTVNTAYLHAKILKDIIEDMLKEDNSDIDKDSIRSIKITRKYLCGLNDLQSTITKLRGLKFSRFNETLFKWAEGNDIKDTSNLLNGKEAVELQKEFENEYKKFLTNNKGVKIINGRKYDLNLKYII